MAPRQILAFGIFELDLRSGELRKSGIRVRLADQPFQVLRLLLERRGDIVTRDELRQALWPADTFVDFDVGLSSAVRKLRDALGDSADNPQFIETVPKRGYRFIAPVAELTTNGASSGSIASPPPGAAPALSGRTRVGWLAAAATLLTIAAGGVYARAAWLRAHDSRAAAASLAVLPFENLTGDTAQAYLVDGLTDVLTTSLAQNDRLQVISRASAMRYRGTTKVAPEIGRELGVQALVLGAVVRSGDRLRVTAQLVDTASDRHVWAHSYDGDVGALVALQDRIAGAIAESLGVGAPSAAAQTLTRRSVSAEAYDSYLHGITWFGRGSFEGFRNAVAYFEKAVAVQPDFALGYGSLAQAQIQFLYASPLPPREIVPKSEAAARKAIALDDSLALGHRVLATVLREVPTGDGTTAQRRRSALRRSSRTRSRRALGLRSL